MAEHKKRKLVIAVLVAVLASGSFLVWRYWPPADQNTIMASGTIETMKVELNAKNQGTLQGFSLKEGDQVKAGQLVARISRNDLVAQKERDALNVEIARNKWNDLQSGATEQERKEAGAGVNIAQVTLDQAKKDLERAEELFSQGSLAQTEIEAVRNKYSIARNQLATAEAKLSLIEEGTRIDQIKAAENQVKLNQAVLKSSQAVLEDLNLYSPIDGIIQTKNRENGEFVSLGSNLATISDLTKCWINVYVPTTDLPYIKIGGKVTFSVSGTERVFEGTVAEIASKGEFTPKSIQTAEERANIVYKVKINADNKEGLLKPGMPADVVIEKNGTEPGIGAS
ncbi:secretion protein HlyD family protein [Syntrophobotulus glycolicus DSM 8271]|uniref:Secretion protein HlyD family protein n=1 Tax=Syntrophobotulus glycolicus (strain DSM 8271 / FlGlyR) TaxID=645991 RepID=F0SVN7_SYNGF|nr:efflux RND transporter periplasmic adaptor subunit [Syntrophobotulus glycolicus]ADY54513.1 secretion protein HlyD family protein [Syntrophobotulus glycolicus DSM 8271]